MSAGVATSTTNDEGDKDVDDDDDKKKDKHKKDNKRKRRHSKRKGKNKRRKKKKKKSLKKRLIKLIKKPFKYARSSIRCSTIAFFILVYIVTLGLFGAMEVHMFNVLQRNDFKACDIDVNRVTRSIKDDASKLSDILKCYSVWDQTVEVIDGLAAGDTTAFDKWYADNFLWNGEWSNTTHNILVLYDANHTFLFGDYHVPDRTIQATQELGDLPEYFKGSASRDFSQAELGLTAEGRYCGIVKPPGSNNTLILCHHPVFHNSMEHSDSHGYILMALDMLPRAGRYADETGGCVSIWEDNNNNSSRSPDSAEAFSRLDPGSIGPGGDWVGQIFHKRYLTEEIDAQGRETGTLRVCTETPKFEETKRVASSFFRFRNGGPLLRVDHPAAMEGYGRPAITTFSMVVIFAFMLFIIIMLVYLDYVVLRRISSLSAFLDSLSKDATVERQDILEAHKLENDPDLAANASSSSAKASKRSGNNSERHSHTNNSRHSVATDTDTDTDSETDTDTSSTTTTSTSTTTTTSTTASTATSNSSSSRVNSVASSESTVAGATGTSGSSATTTTTNTITNTTATTPTSTSTSVSSESENSSGGSSGNKYDKVAQVQKTVNSNIDTLKADITTANISIRRERRWRRRYTHALRLMNLWCGRKDIFPGLRSRDRPPGSTTPTAADAADDADSTTNTTTAATTTTTTTASSNVADDARLQASTTTGIGTGANGSRGYEDMSVDDVLAHPIAMEFLKVHSRFEESQENIFFLLDVTWLQELERLEEVESDLVKRAQMHDTVVSVADHIVKRYIAKGAPQEINISSESMSIVRKLSGSYSKGMFAKAIYDVKMMTSMDVLSRFKHTPAFLAMSEALDVETYDMMSSAAAVASQKKAKERNNSDATGPGIANSSISAGEIQVSAPGSGERGGGDLRSDAYGDSDDEEEDNNDEFNDFEEDDEDNDDNNISKIDKPFRSTFRLMNAIADGAYKPSSAGAGAATSASLFSSADGAESALSDTASTRSAESRSARNAKAAVIPSRNAGSSSLAHYHQQQPSYSSNESLGTKKKSKGKK